MNLWYVTLFFLSFSLSISRSFFLFFSFSRVNIDIVCLSVCCVRVRLSFWLLRAFVSVAHIHSPLTTHTDGRHSLSPGLSLCFVPFILFRVSCIVCIATMKWNKKKIINRNIEKMKNYTHARYAGTGEILAKMRCERKFLAVRMEHFWCAMRPASVANIRWH